MKGNKKSALWRYGMLILTSGILVTLLLLAPLDGIKYWGWDVAVFRAGSKALLNSENPYVPTNIHRFSDGSELASIPYYVYSPFFGILIAPLAMMSPWLAFRLWFLINMILYIISVVIIMSALEWRPRPKAFAGLAVALAFFAPLRTLLGIGQSGVIILFFLSLCFWLLKRGHPYPAGISLSMAFFKPNLFLLLPFFLLRRQWDFLSGFILSIAVTILPFLGLVDDWFRALQFAHAENIKNGCLPFSSLNMFLRCLLHGQDSGILLSWLAMALIAIATFLLIKRNTQTSFPNFDLQMALVVTLGLIVIDNIRVADLVLMIFPFLIALNTLRQHIKVWKRRIVVGLLMMAYIIPYIAAFMLPDSIIWDLPVWYAGMPTALGIALVILLGAYRSRKEIVLAT